MKIALAQMRMKPTPEENMRTSLALLEQAARKGAHLVLYPEIQLCHFFPQYPGRDVSHLALDRQHPLFQEFCRRCGELGVMASPNFYFRDNGRFYDASFLIGGDGACLGVQKMVHIAQAEGFYEQDYYHPSEEGFRVFDTPFGAIGIVICFDRHYPESIRTSVLEGADLILIPTANTAAEPMELFAQEIRVQAFQSCVNVAMCNRVGLEGSMGFAGQSLVAGPDGSVIAMAGEEETLLMAEVDLEGARRMRAAKPYLSLRRPELYL